MSPSGSSFKALNWGCPSVITVSWITMHYSSFYPLRCLSRSPTRPQPQPSCLAITGHKGPGRNLLAWKPNTFYSFCLMATGSLNIFKYIKLILPQHFPQFSQTCSLAPGALSSAQACRNAEAPASMLALVCTYTRKPYLNPKSM